MIFFFILLIDIFFAVVCANIARSKNHEPALWGVLGFFFWIIPLIIISVIDKREPRPGQQGQGYGQALPGYTGQTAAASTPAAPQVSLADEIAQWKKLLDDGAISEEEFAAKKRELLARG